MPFCLQLQPDLFNRLLELLEGDDVEITEEVLSLLRKLGTTARGLEELMSPRTLERLFSGAIDGDPALRPRVVDADAEDEKVMAPFLALVRAQRGAARSAAAEINSVILLRVLTLLTQIACGSRPANDAQGPQVEVNPDAAAVRDRAWSLYQQRGLFTLLLDLASIAPDNGSDMLVQLNGLELLEEVVTACPRLDDAFATQLTQQILAPAVEPIRRAAAAAVAPSDDSAAASLIPTSSFVAVGVLRVLNRLAAVSAPRAMHAWYRTDAFLLFLSAAANAYDEESVQSEALDLLTTLASFAEGIAFFSEQTSTLPASAVAAPARSSAYLSNAYAASETPVLLMQVPYFIYGSNYSNGLRQLAALHGMAKMLATKYTDADESSSPPPAAAADADVAMESKSPESKSAASDAIASPAASSSPSPSRLLRRFFEQLSAYNNGRQSLSVLLVLAKQPFEDLREAVWKLVRALVGQPWGVRAVLATGGFFEYLLDRKTEFHVSGSQAKYDILRAMDANPKTKEMLSQGQRTQLHEYVRQGAHYSPLHVGVMAPVSGFK